MYDTIIIGAGPAGLTAALYSGRYRLKTLLLEKAAAGGQIILSADIENFPGFPGGVLTSELIGKMEKQVRDVGVEFMTSEVKFISPDTANGGNSLTVNCDDRDFRAKTVIIASGAHWKRLGVPGEQNLIGKGVSFCATCDAPFFRNKEVVVVGGGDKAIEEALFLTSYASKVTIIHRRKELRATEVLQEKARSNPKINFVLDSVIEEIIGTNRVESIKVRNVVNQAGDTINCQGVFVFVGVAPSTEFLKESLKLDESGFIMTADDMGTSLKGVFACGDCRKKHLYQVITACAEGAQAAFAAHTYLLKGK